MDQFDNNLPTPLDNDEQEVIVDVCDPVVKDGVQKYILYTIRGADRKGNFEVLRRFSDFLALRTHLVVRWPGCYVPPVPPKKTMGNMDAKFIEDRRIFLGLFTKVLAKIRCLWYSEETDLFLRSPSADIEKTLNALPKQTPGDLLIKYEINFNNLQGKEINQETLNKINQFQAFLRKVLPMMENFQTNAKNIIEQSDKQNEQVLLLIEYLMPEYEKNCLCEYVVNPEGRLIFQNQNQLQSLPRYREQMQMKQLESLHTLLKVENREIEAFIEVIQQREKYELIKTQKISAQKELQQEMQNIQSGKTTLKSIFTKGTKDPSNSKLQQNIDQTQREIDQVQQLCDVITVIIGYVEIDKFKADKEVQYYETLKEMARLEIDLAKLTQEFWGELLLNPNLQEKE